MLNYRYNLFLILRTLVGTFVHTDWQVAYARAGMGGVLRAALQAATGHNAWPFFVRARGEFEPESLRHLLRTRGIASWGWGYSSGEFFFRVRLRQALWAQTVLLEQGVPLTGRLLEETPRASPWRLDRPTQPAEGWTKQPTQA